MKIDNNLSLEMLLEKNKEYATHYKNCKLIKNMNVSANKDNKTRERLLDCIQTFSNYFQKAVMLRYALCDDKEFLPIAEVHLKEEFAHNVSLDADRNHRPAKWDPILESTAAWFSWKMLTLDEPEKLVLIHLVLEVSANIFFKEAHKVMKEYGETDYFKIHSDIDEHHEKLGVELLDNLSSRKYKRLLEVQQQGWDMLNTICDRIASLTWENFDC